MSSLLLMSAASAPRAGTGAGPVMQEALATVLNTGHTATFGIAGPAQHPFTMLTLDDEPEAPTSGFEERALQSLPLGQAGGENIGPIREDARANVLLPAFLPLAPDTVRLTLKRASGFNETVLLIQNGYARPLHFKVTVHPTAGRPAPAEQNSICMIPAKGVSVEHWRFPVAHLVLYEFELLDPASAPRRCW